MYRYRRPKKSKLVPRVALATLLVSAFAAVAWYAPRSSSEFDTREFSDGLSIKINRESPAFAALEDSISSFEGEGDELSPFMPMELIAAGETSFAPQAQAIISSNLETQLRLEAEERIALARVQFQAEQTEAHHRAVRAASSAENSAVSALALPSGFSQAPTIALATTNHESLGAIVAEPGSMLITGGKIISLDAGQNLAIESAPFEHPTRTIKLAELNIDKAELLRSLLFPIVTSGKNESLDKAAASSKTTASLKSAASESTEASRLGGLAARTRPKPIDRPLNSQGISEGADQGIAAASPLVISGPVEMSGGLAITASSDQVVVYREEQGERFEAGYVWLRDGRYEIYVDVVAGRLIGELQTVSGDVLGRGEVSLSSISAGKSQYKVDGVKLAIRPVSNGLRGQVVSAYSNGTKVLAVAQANVDLKDIDQELETETNGKFSDPDVGTGSVVITRVRKEGHWGTLAFIEAGAENVVTMFPDAMMNALLSLTGADAKKPNAVVWGRVSQSGKPAAGAVVEMITGEQEAKAVYFNSLLIPDASLSSTSANGLYAFIVPEAGVHAVQARLANAVMEPVLFPAETGVVTSIDLEVNRGRKIAIKVFDAFRNGQPLSATATPVGSESPVSIDAGGRGILRYALGTGLLSFDVSSEDSYAVTRINLPREKDFIFAPMVEHNWLNEMRSHRRISKELDTGVIVGFVDSRSPYEVYVRPDTIAVKAKILYFDARGRALRTNSGVPGGGYVIFNVPEGLATVSIVSGGAIKLHSATALADRSVVNVFNHSLR